MNVVESDQSFDDEINRNDNIEKPRHDQNQDAGNKRNNRREFGDGYNHDFLWVGMNAKSEKDARLEIGKLNKHSTHKPPFGSSMTHRFGNPAGAKP